VAAERARRLAALSRLLVAAGRALECPLILRRGAEQVSDADFAKVEAAAFDLCAQRLPPELAEVLSSANMTFRELGELWTSGEVARRYRIMSGQGRRNLLPNPPWAG
jgi:hypothetical protein